MEFLKGLEYVETQIEGIEFVALYKTKNSECSEQYWLRSTEVNYIQIG